jgi:hypothetical protein
MNETNEAAVFLKALNAKYVTVTDLGSGYFFVEWRGQGEGHELEGGIYSREEKKIVGYCTTCQVLSPDLIHLVTITRHGYYGQHRRYRYKLFSRKNRRLISFGEYSMTSPLSLFWVYVMTSFQVVKELAGVGPIGNDWGVFNTADESFIIRPQYTKLIHLGNNQYYGAKEDRGTGKETYFLIEIDEKGKVTTQETSKIA